ncbi:aspartyl protease family protein [Sphingobacterium sp. SYP-B4668]|uniref:aspartyl protease family protein n=1 Tax=Sphingobacterium sp. SYP-B4668 TaxID=2996035 RepID=UPI0022DE0A3E|nr:aspartyl protease family protein [Sphingobacterium sp. SYP-B4668]
MKLTKFLFGYVAIFLLFVTDSFAQKLNTTILHSLNFCDTIPFEYTKGKIIVKAIVNAKPARFIFDTGAPFLISDRLCDELRLSSHQHIRVTDVSTASQDLPIVEVNKLAVGNINFSNAQAIVYEKGKTGIMDCFDVEGLIGSTIVKDCIVHIDAKRQVIILTDRVENIGIENSTPTKIRLDENSRPFVPLHIGVKSKIEALFDSGSDKILPLSFATFQKLEKEKAVSVLNKGYGSISSSLFGPGQKGKEYRIHIGSLLINTTHVDGIVATASEYKNKNAIGMGISQYGTITIDYPKKRFYFNPYKAVESVNNQSFLGFEAQQMGDSFVISAVYENSPAAKSGLKYGQKIIQIDDLKINGSEDVCEAYLKDTLKRESIVITIMEENGEVKILGVTREQ